MWFYLAVPTIIIGIIIIYYGEQNYQYSFVSVFDYLLYMAFFLQEETEERRKKFFLN